MLLRQALESAASNTSAWLKLEMTTAITIGSYRMPQFIELCVIMCLELWGDVPILISDDFSDRTEEVRVVAAKYDCEFVTSSARRSHFSGDIQTYINALVFARDSVCDVALKISQRVIPVQPLFREAMERAFKDPKMQIVCPGKIKPQTIARPQARFYQKFGILSDVFAIRTGAISADEIMGAYRRHAASQSNAMVETMWGAIVASRFKDRHVVLPEWTDHTPFKPKVFLRKSQSTNHEYESLAKEVGISGDWDLREWNRIEGKNYVMKGNKI